MLSPVLLLRYGKLRWKVRYFCRDMPGFVITFMTDPFEWRDVL